MWVDMALIKSGLLEEVGASNREKVPAQGLTGANPRGSLAWSRTRKLDKDKVTVIEMQGSARKAQSSIWVTRKGAFPFEEGCVKLKVITRWELGTQREGKNKLPLAIGDEES